MKARVSQKNNLKTFCPGPRLPEPQLYSSDLGDLILLGAGVKMGPSPCATSCATISQVQVNRRVIAVARSWLLVSGTASLVGVETIAADLLAPGAFDLFHGRSGH